MRSSSLPRRMLLLTLLLLLSSLAPLAAAGQATDDAPGDRTTSTDDVVLADLASLDLDTLHPYAFIDSDEPVYSATGAMREAWAAADRPGLVLPFSDQAPRTSGRACENAWSEGDQTTVPTSGGSIPVEAEKVTSTAVFFVHTSSTVSSSTLNSFASTWESTIYPTDTLYFGAAPDVDNNCQIEVVLYSMDGPFGLGGYFAPGFSGSREIIFVDADDATQSWSRVILAHEFEHLLHNARDPFEYNWLDEGAADYAAYLCFGQESTLVGHANSWSSNASQGVRWWNQRQGDYGAGFLFVMYLSEWLNGATGIKSLIADTDTGGDGVENLAASGVDGQPSPIGRNMEDIFANFTIATALDTDQSGWGYPSLTFGDFCGGALCKLQMSGTNSNWAGTYTSSGNTMDGWGVHAWRLTGGTGAMLNLRVQSSHNNMGGRVMSHDAAQDVWSATPLTYANNQATGLVPSFGNATDEVVVITWFESTPSDCNYTGCGSPYPSASVQLDAALITDPATVTLDSVSTFDRDLDGFDDSVHLAPLVNSTAFAETLDLVVEARDANGTAVDSATLTVTAGGGVGVVDDLWWTPATNGTYTLAITMRDQLGFDVDTTATTPLDLRNMRPLAQANINTRDAETWDDIVFTGSGLDRWGFGENNGTYAHSDAPVGYLWDFGDGNTSARRSPTRAYTNVGSYNASLQILDQGGAWSAAIGDQINITDNSTPVPSIRINGNPVGASFEILTDQRIIFSAAGTTDNVPLSQLGITWDWDDGNGSSGVEASHAWPEGEADGTTYTVTLTVNDSTHEAQATVDIIVYNRPPRTIYERLLVIPTLTPLSLPTVFEDLDGEIVSLSWDFPGGVNLDGVNVTATSDFSATQSSQNHPRPAWRNAGNVTLTVTAEDDDGNTSFAILQVTVLNQRPVAQFARPADGTVDTNYTFDGSASFDPDGEDAALTYNWSFSDTNTSVTGPSVATHRFLTPGSHTVTLVVTDTFGESSVTKTYVVRIANPPPIAEMQVLEAWVNGSLVTSETPRTPGTTYAYSHAFTSDDSAFASPGTLLWFDTQGTRDGDARFAGLSGTNISAQDWNGIVQYTWDFGDASPPSHDPQTWHAYREPGTYLVRLTVRDGFGTGDTTTVTRTVVVNAAPTINNPDSLTEDILAGEEFSLFGIASDAEVDSGLEAWRDVLLEVDRDADGDAMNDRDPALELIGGLSFFWDLDDRVDFDGDGDARNDWVNQKDIIDHIWEEDGDIEITLMVCDGLDVCSEQTIEATVRATGGNESELGEFDWRELAPAAGDESMFLLGLVALVAVLAWLVLRAPDEEELDAEEAAGAYDVSQVRAEGGVLGMDQHNPPPKPKQLSSDERTSGDSGYTRPVRLRRR